MVDAIANMSSEELFELAKSRQIEEERETHEQSKQELSDLRKERRKLLIQQKKELAELDEKIDKLRKKISRSGATSAKSNNSSVNISATVLSLLETHHKMTTKELQDTLSDKGVVATNLSQTLAYLKRQGKITSPTRATYEIGPSQAV